jgi:hypothetical protein
VAFSEGRRLAKGIGVPFAEVSGTQDLNIPDLFATIVCVLIDRFGAPPPPPPDPPRPRPHGTHVSAGGVFRGVLVAGPVLSIGLEILSIVL